ncbi:hypothetical protein MLD38_007843 [Melastoma candidum]|uniref:Uncharacterized protein n=1 Tax=Melastoma candidum TaxID=119954 RepID=A0ACB9RSK0_9MYRT|nr:hypothetical protein MLD38_007843 [Melastoma candidum]
MKEGAGNPSSSRRAAIVPPRPPPLPRKRAAVTESVTNREIARYWRQRRIEEEDHLLAAIKAAARVRARNLSEDEYRCFLESLEEADRGVKVTSLGADPKANDGNEARVIIMDWWTKSKYAYLNQPAIGATETPRKRISDYSDKGSNNYTPNCFTFKPAVLGVF